MSNEERRGTSRSGFLKQAAGATIAVAGAGAGAGVFAEGAAAFARGPRQTISLDGTFCGKLGGGISGGDLVYEVVPDLVGSDHLQRKHLGQGGRGDISLDIGSNMSKPMYQWIKDSMDHGYDPALRRRVEVLKSNSDDLETGRQVFEDALITEVSIPALDRAATGQHHFINLKLSVEAHSSLPGSGLPVQARSSKPFTSSNFVLVIGGLDTKRVATIDSFTWKNLPPPPPPNPGGDERVLDAGNLVVTFDPASLPSWQSWFDNAATGAEDERDGELTLVGANGGAVITVGLGKLGIYRLERDTPDAAGVRRVKAEMYCEQMDFKYEASWA